MVTAKKDEAIKLKKAADALKATEDKGAEGVNAHKWVQSDRMLLLALSWHFLYKLYVFAVYFWWLYLH